MASEILTGELGDGGKLYASVDSTAHHVTGEARPSRLAALLAPFRTQVEAKAALEAAGATVTAGGGK